MLRITDSEFQKRIRDSEHFNSFLVRRDELAGGGMSKRDAYDTARDEFMPLVTGDAEEPVLSDIELPSLPPSTDLRQDLLWIYNNLNGGATIEDCPSSGAWAFYCHVQDSNQLKAKFLEVYLPKILPTKAELERMSRKQDDGAELVTLNAFIEKAYKEAIVEQEEVLAGTSGVPWGQMDA